MPNNTSSKALTDTKQAIVKFSSAAKPLISSSSKSSKNMRTTWKYEIKAIAQVENYVDEKTLVVYDLDNTVYRPVQLIGRDEWFEAHLKREQLGTRDFKQALATTLEVYDKVHEISQVIPVEENLADIISIMQAKNDVIALTARGGNLATATIRQLNSINVDFNKGKFKDQNFDLLPQQSLASRKALSNSGIVFCNGGDKGEYLKDYLDKIGYRPQRIVCVEDKEINLDKIKKMTDSLGIDFIGLHYTYLEDNLNISEEYLEQADIQLHYALNATILSDEHAKVLYDYEKSKISKKPRLSLGS